MPEYLAPGVYVEETSFRAKSIEGVGTSTTAFVGPARRGPIVTTEPDAAGNPPAAPELLTSFGDFERMYGGLEDLSFGGTPVTNYLAHSVLQFFNEGGARLYVARVANQPTTAATANLRTGAAANESVFIRSRFGGGGGSGRVTVAEIATPANADQLDSAASGLFLRVSDPTAAAASVEGGPVPANLATIPPGAPGDDIVLNLTVNGTDRALAFAGQAATIAGTADVSDPLVVTAADREFRVRINGTLQVVQLPVGNTPRASLPAVLNGVLTGATASLDAQRIRLTTTRRGAGTSIQVLNARLGFQPGPAVTSAFDAANNNVGDLSAVTFPDLAAHVAALNASLPAGTAPELEVVELAGGRFALRTLRSNSTAALAIRGAGAGEASAHAAFGLPAPGASAAGAGAAPTFFQRASVTGQQVWHVPGDTATRLTAATIANRELHVLSFSLVFDGAEGDSTVFDDLAFGRDHARFPATFLVQHPAARSDALLQPVWFEIGGNVDPLELHNALFPAATTRIEDGRAVATHELTGGGDGGHPMVGTPTDLGSYSAAFELLRGLEDISIVAAPGHSDYPAAEAIRNALIAHAERPRAYRIAVLDAPPRQLPGDVRNYRARFDSHRAALYYPWVTVPNPLARPGRDDVELEINLPPSGFIAGIYARNDVEQGVSKAPANEVVRGAIRFESDINFAQQQLLNPLGVNCLRYLPGRGYRVWGARTASSDPEWKYVNVRRFFLYL
ncbi:MAG: phage tail sheath subtilisin-like domain-containing protein, partial [Opitutaceae bacterium]